MKDILLIVLPFLTSLITYFGVRYQYKIEFKKQKELNDTEIQKVKELCQNEIDKIKVSLKEQANLYEKNAMTDVTKDFVSDLLKNPKQATDAMKSLSEIASVFNMKF